ncbi:MAG: FAD binding domain-containing protein [Treponema sp.]|jgi:xanthine dehydrogenase iron-sulfur cluster and FAD-binding subunit A|nr:FAD binding domain-containing protein [Treponema sp.]
MAESPKSAWPQSSVLRPFSLNELFALWERYPDAVPYSGGTGSGRTELPNNILSLEGIEELGRITRTERYLELGAMVRLSEIIALGKNTQRNAMISDALTLSLLHTAAPAVRNLATIGGCVISGGDALAAMTALDARYELRGARQTRWISAARFSVLGGVLAYHELLTRIRIPLEQWDYTIPYKFDEGTLLILIRNQKNLLAKIQVIFGGKNLLLRDKNTETFLEGQRLPLEKKDVLRFVELWENYLAGLGTPDPFLKTRILNSIEAGLLGLAV